MKGVPELDEEICVGWSLDPCIHLKDPSQLHITHCKLCRRVLLTVLLSALSQWRSEGNSAGTLTDYLEQIDIDQTEPLQPSGTRNPYLTNLKEDPALVCAAAERYKCNSDQLSLARRKLAHL